MKYLPFLDGKYSTAPALNALPKAHAQDQHVFQIDDEYDTYIGNKLACRKEDIHKYYVEAELADTTSAAINRLIVQQLIKEQPKPCIALKSSPDPSSWYRPCLLGRQARGSR